MVAYWFKYGLNCKGKIIMRVKIRFTMRVIMKTIIRVKNKLDLSRTVGFSYFSSASTYFTYFWSLSLLLSESKAL